MVRCFNYRLTFHSSFFQPIMGGARMMPVIQLRLTRLTTLFLLVVQNQQIYQEWDRDTKTTMVGALQMVSS